MEGCGSNSPSDGFAAGWRAMRRLWSLPQPSSSHWSYMLPPSRARRVPAVTRSYRPVPSSPLAQKVRVTTSPLAQTTESLGLRFPVTPSITQRRGLQGNPGVQKKLSKREREFPGCSPPLPSLLRHTRACLVTQSRLCARGFCTQASGRCLILIVHR